MCRLIYVEKRLYIHDMCGKKVDVSHRMTTELTTTSCHQVGSRRPFDRSCCPEIIRPEKYIRYGSEARLR